MDYRTGLYFLIFLNVVFSTPDAFYTVHLENFTFEEARKSCENDNSFLTNMANQQETFKILKAIEDKRNQTVTSFWIGLYKPRTECVQANVPLRGFFWIVDNSTQFDDAKWGPEPTETCTNVLCGLLSVTYSGSTVQSWQLVSRSCRHEYPSICKHQGQSEKRPCPGPSINTAYDIVQKHNDPYTVYLTCNNKNFTLTCSKTTREWTLLGSTKTDIMQLCLECKPGYKRNAEENCVDVNECESLHQCKHGCINTEGSHICKCPYGTEKGSENCVKEDELPSSTTSPDVTDSPENPTSSSTEKMPPTDNTSKGSVSIEESPENMSNIIIPVIIALLILVVLVVIIAGIIKCCLIRRSKKRAKKRAEAMALNGSDSMEKVNEKEAT